jgi:hypothetical protein
VQWRGGEGGAVKESGRYFKCALNKLYYIDEAAMQVGSTLTDVVVGSTLTDAVEGSTLTDVVVGSTLTDVVVGVKV